MTAGAEHRPVVAYIGLGANLNDPISQLLRARQELSQNPQLREVAFSSLYRSAPMGPQDQPDYVNAVIAVETRLAPESLLAVLHEVENAHGRTRIGEQWGPRTLDLDLLLYGNETVATPTLRVPHPGLGEREFVLVPLLEIAPSLTLPDGQPLSDLILTCSRRESPLIRIEETRA
ncbi:2-amino-4-hydroxy-6-hydroxymethyldihydropteridine diphosphokinase [Methylolobus aquaticus]